jgi:hypothetical protein
VIYCCKYCLDLVIKIVAEILLPQILREEVPTTGSNNSSVTSTKPSVSVDVVSVMPAKVTKNQSNLHAAVESNRLRVLPKEDVVADNNNTSDAFAFVTEMKIQMSQPQNATSVPSVENSSVNRNKGPGERGRGGGRGIGRGARRSPQSKTTDILDNSSNARHSLQSQASDTTSSTAVQGTSQNMNNLNTKPRGGYAQAVKRSGAAGDNAVTKSPVVSQASPAKATSANGSPSCSGSQKC